MVGRLRVAKVCPSPLKILLALRAARFAAYCEIRAKLAIRSEGRADEKHAESARQQRSASFFFLFDSGSWIPL